MSAIAQTQELDLVAIGRTNPRMLRLLTPGPIRPGWQNQIACADLDPEMFFPERRRPLPAQAAAACAVCPAAADCLNSALLEGEENGYWAGVDMGQVFGRGARARQSS